MLIQRAAVCLLLAAMWTTCVAASPNPADARKIDACLKAASDKDASGVACIGIVADPCIKAASTTNTFIKDSAACAARELAVWTTRLQRALQSANRASGKDMAAAVAASQKSFTDSLARLCPVFAKLDPGMSLGGAAYCRMQATAMRALQIERLSAAVNEH
jgi:hypothetical protein